MSNEIATIQSVDGKLELVLCPASIELRLTEATAEAFNQACENEKASGWLPIWKQIKAGLISATQFIAKRFADKLRVIPLENIKEIQYSEGKIIILTEKKNQIKVRFKLQVASFKLECDLDKPGLFPAEETMEFITQFEEVKQLYKGYIKKVEERKLIQP